VKALLVVATLAAGCTRSQAGASLAPAYDDSGRLARLSYDSNGDGRPDMVASMEGAMVRAVEVDEDGDGQPDRWEHYQGAEAPVRIERVARRGSRIVRREIFERGTLVRVEEDRDGDGRADRWETYTDGSLTMLELDSSRAGRADRRLRYEGDQLTIESLP
jgi:hypothetical protein